MATGTEHAGFFPNRIAGSEVFEDDIFEAARQSARDIGGKVIGEAVIDAGLVGLGITVSADAINERRLNITGTLSGILDSGEVFSDMGTSSTLVQVTEGSRTYTINDPDWWALLPYENADTIVYNVYAQHVEFPVNVGIGANGGRGYSKYAEAPGWKVTPDAIVDSGTFLRIELDAVLTALGMERWLTASTEDNTYSYDCVVYLNTDTSGVEIQTDDPDIAIALQAKLVAHGSSTGWVIILDTFGDGYLGQSVPSLVAADYEVVILGPIITTTDFDANEDYLHIAAVTSAPGGEVIDTTAQEIIQSVSDTLNDIVTVPSTILEPGWTTKPATTIAPASTITVTSIGEAFVSGQLVDTPTGAAFTGLAATTFYYIYYDHNSGVVDFAITTSAETAFGNGRVPFQSFLTNGSGEPLGPTRRDITKLQQKYRLTRVLTVADDILLRPDFTELEDALAYVAAFRDRTIDDQGITIEIIGDVTVTGVISTTSVLALKNVTIVGRGGGIPGNGAGATNTAFAQGGARIIWGGFSLIDVVSGSSLINWAFKDLTFRYTGAEAANRSVVELSGTFIDGLIFDNCVIDGNGATTSAGGGGGTLPHVVSADTGSILNLELRRCKIYTTHAAIANHTATTAGIQKLKVIDCLCDNNNSAVTFTQVGFIWDDETTTSPGNWVIRNNTHINGNGPSVRAFTLIDSFIHDNWFSIDVDDSVIFLGNVTTDDNVERVFIHSNYLRQDGGGEDIIRIIGQDESGTNHANIVIHSNIIDGFDAPVGCKGIAVNIANGAALEGLMIHSNVIQQVDEGIDVNNIQRGAVLNNLIEATLVGITVDDAGGPGGHVMCLGNAIYLDGDDVTGIDLTGVSASIRAIVGMNLIDLRDITSTTTSYGIRADAILMDGCMFVANHIGSLTAESTFGLDIDGEFHVIIGNLLSQCDHAISAQALGGHVIVGNGFISSDPVGWEIDDCLIVGNLFEPILADWGPSGAAFDDTVFVGNLWAGLTDVELDGQTMVFCGNLVSDVLDCSVNVPAECTIVGNVMEGGFLGSGASLNMAVTGNFINGNVGTVAGVQQTWTGNFVSGVGTNTFSGTDFAIVGNTFNVLTDSTTSSTVASNEIY